MPQPTPTSFTTSLLLPVPHGMFNGLGGVSAPPFASLNLSFSVGDNVEHVRANRILAQQALALPHLLSVKQVHSDRILLAQEQHIGIESEGFDAIISTLPGTGLLIQQADCQAILLWAPQPPVVAAIHCGWRGSVLGIIGKTVARMQREYGVAPETIRAVISPSLGPCCAEFVNYRQELPTWMHALQTSANHFDFWAISRRQLTEAGIVPQHIDTAGLCTKCNESFFSYRRAVHHSGGITGRNGSIIGLPG